MIFNFLCNALIFITVFGAFLASVGFVAYGGLRGLTAVTEEFRAWNHVRKGNK